MRTLLCYVYGVICLLLTVPKRLKARELRQNGDIDGLRIYCTEVARYFARTIFNCTGSTVEMRGLENIPEERTVLFVCNHQGNFDMGVILGYIDKPKGYIAKDGVDKLPIVRRWMHDMDCVFMHREDIKKAAKAISQGVELLKSGWSMLVFPEGRRSKSNEMGPFKHGSFKLATKSKVPIVPVTIDGTYKIMEANNSFIRPAHVIVTIHPIVETADLNSEELKNLPTKVQNIIASALTKD